MNTAYHIRRSPPSGPGPILTRRVAMHRIGVGLTTGLWAMTGVTPAAAQEASPTTATEQPPFMETWLTAWSGDPSAADALYAEDAVLEDVPAGMRYEGRDAIRGHIEEEFAALPDLNYEVRSAFAAGERAAAEVVLSGSYTGTLPGLPPGTGQSVNVPAGAIFELADGLIQREAHYYDVYGLLVQLGAIPAPEGEGTPST